jgi:hypothetical protein
VNDTQLDAGDGVAVDRPGSLTLEGTSEAEVLLFDMQANETGSSPAV